MYVSKLYNIIEDDYGIHKKVMETCPGMRPLFQTRGGCVIIVTEGKPAGDCETKERKMEVKEGGTQLFTLRLNPAKRDKKSGKRVGLYGEEANAWIKRKTAEAGFEILDCRIDDEGMRVSKRGDETVTLRSVFLTGFLRVNNAEAFKKALVKGIGHAKGFGFGLLNIF